MPLFHIITLGCPKNTVDSERYAGSFVRAGWEHTDNAEEAEIILVNTCAFIEPAVTEAMDVLDEVIVWKSRGEERKIILAGCLLGRYETDDSEGMEDIDLLMGPAEVDVLDEYLELAETKYQNQSKLDSNPWRYLKISEGCSNNCAYCTIPMIRGSLKCRKQEDIMKDLTDLVSQGAVEIGIIAQDTCAWKDGTRDIVRLIDRLTSKYPDIWFRLQYLHPGHFTHKLLELIVERENLMPYIDIPIQHVSNRILERMGRGYCKEDLESLFQRIEDASCRLAVRVTVIAGYPGETAEELDELQEFLLKWKCIRTLAVFPYFHEQDTLEYERNSDRHDDSTVSERVSILGDITGMIMNSWKEELEGERLEILAHTNQYGHSKYDAPDVDWMSRFTEDVQPGNIIECTVEECFGYEMIVKPIQSKNGSG